MELDEAFSTIKARRPSVVYLSGKTCTGKSTFAERLSADLEYDIVSLDDIVRDAVIKPLGLESDDRAFVEVYRNREHLDWIKLFVDGVTARMGANLAWGRNTVVDGAIANPETVKDMTRRWFKFSFIYLHPANLDNYVRNITQRVQLAPDHHTNLPKSFWSFVEREDFNDYCRTGVLNFGLFNSIERYAKASQGESLERLADFQPMFKDITLVDV